MRSSLDLIRSFCGATLSAWLSKMDFYTFKWAHSMELLPGCPREWIYFQLQWFDLKKHFASHHLLDIDRARICGGCAWGLTHLDKKGGKPMYTRIGPKDLCLYALRTDTLNDKQQSQARSHRQGPQARSHSQGLPARAQTRKRSTSQPSHPARGSQPSSPVRWSSRTYGYVHRKKCDESAACLTSPAQATGHIQSSASHPIIKEDQSHPSPVRVRIIPGGPLHFPGCNTGPLHPQLDSVQQQFARLRQ